MAWKWSGGSKGAGNVSASDEWTGFFDQGVSLEGTLQLSGTFRLNGQGRRADRGQSRGDCRAV